MEADRIEFHRRGHFSQSKKENSESLHRSRNTKGSIMNTGVNVVLSVLLSLFYLVLKWDTRGGGVTQWHSTDIVFVRPLVLSSAPQKKLGERNLITQCCVAGQWRHVLRSAT